MSYVTPKRNTRIPARTTPSTTAFQKAENAKNGPPADSPASELVLPIKTAEDLKTRIKTIKRHYKCGDFRGDLQTAARNLFDYYKHAGREETREYWRGKTLLYELNDLFNINTEICDTTFAEGNQVREDLRTRAIKHQSIGFVFSERKVLLEKALFCACYAHELQRRGEKQLALQIVEWLLDFVRKFMVVEDELPCYGIQATLCYHVGSVLRKLEQHRRAELMFSEAIDLLYKRSQSRPDDLDDYFFVLRKQAIIIGLGFGLTNLAKGSLQRAEHALKTARSLLARSSDPVTPAYVELHCGVVERCRAGTNQDKLKSALLKLENARSSLPSHNRYQVRARWELAMAKTLLHDFAGARKDLAYVAAYAEKASDRKWAANVHILQSRMLRMENNCSQALEEAEIAVQASDGYDCKIALPLIDALLTRGEALMADAEEKQSIALYAVARADFDRALRYVLQQESGAGDSDRASNPKIAAVCELRIAQTYARQGDENYAQSHFSEWSRLENQVEHGFVRELAKQVKDDIDKLSKNFVISATDEDEWGYTENVARLRQWLLKRVLRHTNQNYSEAARLLGVQRATLYQWLTQEDPDTKRRSRLQK
jgi:DNA-binding protein Fis